MVFLSSLEHHVCAKLSQLLVVILGAISLVGQDSVTLHFCTW